MFLRKSRVTRDPLAVTMSGVRLGERVLQIGAGDAQIVATISARTGLTGTAAVVVREDDAAVRVRRAIEAAGTLADVRVVAGVELPFEEATFDAVVVHDAPHTIAATDIATRSRWIAECRRVLRGGGRVVTIEAGTPTGIRALFRTGPADRPTTNADVESVSALRSGGFASVRLLGDREGLRFVEGVKTS